jgi:transposase
MMPQTSSGSNPSALVIVNPHAAGLDIGSEEIWACVPSDRDAQPVRCFGTYTPDLHALSAWLKTCGIQTVAMESTGVYWIPIYEILEADGLRAQVVNARHLKHVPGRKSDIQDCQWIQRLHTVGLLTASFRPEAEVSVLRAYVRQRAMLIEHRAAHIQHMQKALHQMNVQLSQVLSDITGKTGQAIIRSIVAGQCDPHQLAQLRDERCAKNETDIEQALTGNYRAEHVFALKQAVTLYDAYTTQIQACDVELERLWTNLPPAPNQEATGVNRRTKHNTHSKNAPTYDVRGLLYHATGVDLVAISGLNAITVQDILVEVGFDLHAFPSEKQFSAWLGLAPHNDISGGKVLRSRTLKSGNRAGQAFRMAAQSVSRQQDGFGAYYRRQRARLGPAKAIVATAHKIARVFYHVLKHRVPFEPISLEQFDQQVQQREIANLKKKAAKLGFTVLPATT